MSDVKGITPVVDPTRSDDLFVLDGRNFVFDATGPKSAFGSRFLLPHRLINPIGVQGSQLDLQIGRRNFTITNESIQIWNEESGGWKFVYIFAAPLVQDYRWTTAYVNGKIGFCHPDIGILVYDVETESCDKLTDLTIGSPERPIAICANNGRPVVIGPDLWTCGNPSDLLDWEIKLGGSVFQVINDRVPGYPIMVTSFAGGTLTWTTGGVMRSEFTADSAVYRHRAIQTKYKPANSYCVAQLNDEAVVILDERGLFQTQGDSPTPYAPIFNEFIGPFIKDNNLDMTQALRLEWESSAKRLYLSVKMPYGDAAYDRAFVHYQPLDKWGSFDSKHYGILPIWIESGSRKDDYFGFVDSTGRFNYWLETADREILPVDSTLDLHYPLIQKPLTADSDSTSRYSSSSSLLDSKSRSLEPADPPPPVGFSYLVDLDGNYLLSEGNYLIDLEVANPPQLSSDGSLITEDGNYLLDKPT